MAKYNVYAVAYGIDAKNNEPVFNLKLKTWDECKPYVAGVPGAKYKGFLTNSEADAWLDQVLADMGLSNPDAKTKQSNISWKEKADKIADSKIHLVDKDFTSICKKLCLNQVDVEHMIKKIFIDTIKYLEDNGCFDKEEE